MKTNSLNDLLNFQSAISAFVGALFAFIFLRFSGFLERLYQRKHVYITSLVNIERCLIENYDLLHENVFKIEMIVKRYNEAKTKGYALFYANKINVIPFDNDSFNNISNLDFLNELINYKGKLRKFNIDIENLFTSLNSLRTAR